MWVMSILFTIKFLVCRHLWSADWFFFAVMNRPACFFRLTANDKKRWDMMKWLTALQVRPIQRPPQRATMSNAEVLRMFFFESCIVKRFTKKRKTTRFQHSVLPFPEPRRRRLHLTSLGRKGVSMSFDRLRTWVGCVFAFLHLAKAEGVRRPPRPGKPLRAKVAQENTLFSKSKQHKDWKNV